MCRLCNEMRRHLLRLSKVIGFMCRLCNEHVSTPSTLSEVTSFMCRLFNNMCQHFKPSFFSSYTLSPCVNTSISTRQLLIISFSNFVLWLHVSTPQIHVLTSDHSFSKFWSLSLCVDTSKSCVNTFIIRLSTIFIYRRLKIMCWHFHFRNQFFTTFMCQDHMIMCRCHAP